MIVEMFKCDRCGVMHQYDHNWAELMAHYGWIELTFREGMEIKTIELCSDCAADVLLVAKNDVEYELKVVE